MILAAMLSTAALSLLLPSARMMPPALSPFSRVPVAHMAVATPAEATDVLPRSPLPRNAAVSWALHKFGGASLATPELYQQCGDLLIDESRRQIEEIGSCVPTMAIVSARGGVTDRLIKVVEASLQGIDESKELMMAVASEQVEAVRILAGDEIAAEVGAQIMEDAESLVGVMRAISLLRTIPPSTMELVTGYGEVWSAMTMQAYLRGKGVPTAWLDARDLLIVEQSGGAGLGDKGSSNTVGTDPLWDLTAKKVVEWFAAPDQAHLGEADCKEAAPIVVVTGFVASTQEGAPTTLKRSGSDYSATIFAKLMDASGITMWKNVNGVYTADPRVVPEAYSIERLKYDEAIELAYFGAQVLHPSAMQPCIEGEIPIYVRNVFNPSHPGTVIEGRACMLSECLALVDTATDDGPPIKGITSVNKVALLTVEGTGASAVDDLVDRLFASLRRAGIPTLMHTQASAESSICVVLEETSAQAATVTLEMAFERELQRGLIAGISTEYGHSVVAIVGEGMAFRPGTGATFTRAMANAGINIRAIAQGSSERQISIAVESSDCSRALRAAHAALALSNTQVSVAVLGASGDVGSEFLRQVADSKLAISDPSAAGKRQAVDELNIDYKVTALARSGCMRLSYDGIDVSAGLGEGETQPTDLDELTNFLRDDFNGNRVVIDCTASQQVADYYPRWLSSGIHVIATNKKAGSGPADLYNKAKKASLRSSAQWLYATTAPGSGLPVLATLKDMRQSGDVVESVSGRFSASISYIFSQMAQGVPLSRALAVAYDKGLCEPDPRDDLNGVDNVRQLVVLGRDLGLELEVADVECESLLPATLQDWAPDTSDGAPPLIEQLCAALEPYDKATAERVSGMLAEGHVPVQLSSVDVATGKASVKAFAPVNKEDRVARCAGGEIIVEICSRRYAESPMVLQGPGAGLKITAAGLFADLLRLSRSLVEFTFR